VDRDIRSVAVSSDGVRVPIALRRVKEIAVRVLRSERIGAALISIAFVGRRTIATLNRKHLGHRGPTDVISFGFGETVSRQPVRGAPAVIGDIYIAPEIAGENARRFGVPVREEIARLVIHGTLHVIGHDHPDGDERVLSAMWRRQEALLRRLVAVTT